jgi:hypothetical protein
MRSTGSGTVLPANRYFHYDSQLHSGISPTRNLDVADITGGLKDNAYVSLYIVTTGLNDLTFAPIYSIPTFVGIFKLPI